MAVILLLCLLVATLPPSVWGQAASIDAVMFHCGSGELLPFRWHCDGLPDCSDSSDESDCGCQLGQYECSNGQCIHEAYYCDKNDDCSDGSDAFLCPEYRQEFRLCESWEYRCTNGRCIRAAFVCDGDNDCFDNSDESNCTDVCTETQFMCNSNRKCIPSNWRCDTEIDCFDGSDEEDCFEINLSFNFGFFKCSTTGYVNINYICDGIVDCPADSSDEDNCPNICDCGLPNPPMNGTVETFPENEPYYDRINACIAEYSCANGFELRGMVSRICQEDGQWSDQTPHCSPVECGSIVNPLNGMVDTSSGTTFTNVATYSCNRGYILNGVPMRSCSADQQWRPEAPSCNLVDCCSLNNPANGRVDTSSGTTFMNIATYICDTGYRLIGESSRECQENGEWSSKPVNCTTVDCGTLKAPANGHVDMSQGAGFMNTAVYSCDPGYNLTGCSVAVCQSNATWSCDPPFCADNSIIQLKFGPTRYCVEWTNDKINLMYKMMHIAITKAVQRKGYDIPVENIQQGYFSCYQSTTRTTYRTTITGTERLSAVDYTDMIQEWVGSGVTTRVLWYAIKMDKTCPVPVASMDQDECAD